MKQSPHKWLLSYEPAVAKQIAKLPDRDIRQAVFNSLAERLRMDNPVAPNTGVAKIAEIGDVWRFHVEIKNYSYQVLFRLESSTIVVEDIEYRGRLRVLGVIAKKDKPY